ncbi:MAG: acyl-CoA dehydrogenase family protein [Acidimicrobiales bacterium]
MTMLENRPVIALADTVLEGFRARAAEADRSNTYFYEDLAALRDAGYLTAAVPVHFGGGGYDLADLAAEQRRIARFAPATALALCMHHYWVGIAVEFERAGDQSLRWILEAAVEGKVFAAGHAERGNDAPVVMSTSTAVPVDGGYRFTGRKMFGSNGPVWSYLGVHALDMSDPTKPVIVHGFVDRNASGVTVVETWDTLGMRPSQSHDTILDDVFVPTDRIGRVVPAGSDADLFLIAMNVWALALISHVYLGIADRALELSVEGTRTKTSVAIPRGAYAYNPMVQHQIAEMVLELDAASATAQQFLGDWLAGADLGQWWAVRILSSKWRAVTAAKRVVDTALEVSGGAGMFRGNELERLYRDVRCGGFHPANDALTHELVAKVALGIGPDEPRW